MNKYLFIISVFVVFTACKKSEPNSSSNTSFPESPHTTSSATSYHGIFASANYTQVIGSAIYASIFTEAYFSNTPTTSMNQPTAVGVNKLTFNGSVIPYDTISLYYPVTVNSIGNETWQIEGAAGIPSFNHASYNNVPNCSSFTIAVSSVSKSAGFTIQINDVINATSGSNVILSDGVNIITKQISNGNNTIVFTPTEISSLNTTTTGHVRIALENSEVLNFYGKDFKFLKERVSYKRVSITS